MTYPKIKKEYDKWSIERKLVGGSDAVYSDLFVTSPNKVRLNPLENPF